MRIIPRVRLLTIAVVPVLALGIGGTVQGTTEPAGGGSGTCLPEGGIEAKDSYLIGMSQANQGEPWRQAMNDQIAAAAEAHPELEVVFADAAQDNAQQVADVENFLSQGIDLLIISPNEAAPLTDVVAAACAEGVPVIVLDRKVEGDQFTMWIGADNVQIGVQAGQHAAEFCTEQGHDPCAVMEIRGLEGSTPAQERGDGFREGLAENPTAEIIASQNADWLRERAIPVSQAMFQANPDVHVVYTHNDPMTEAAIISAESAGLRPRRDPVHRHRRPAHAGRRHPVGDRRTHRRHLRLSHRRRRGDRLRRADPRGGRRPARRGDPRDPGGHRRQRPSGDGQLHRWRGDRGHRRGSAGDDGRDAPATTG